MMGSLGTARNLGNSNILIAIASALGSVLGSCSISLLH